MAIRPEVKVAAVDAAAYTVPTDGPEADGTLAWSTTTLVRVTVEGGRETGLGWTYGPTACVTAVRERLADVAVGRDALDVPGTWAALVDAVRNDTRRGVMGYALSAVDAALWDLKARLLDVSLVGLLGAASATVPVYGSGGFTSYDDRRTAEQLRAWTERDRIPRVKIKIGQSWGDDVSRDLARVRLARGTVGDDVALMVDANGAYQRKQAVRVARAMEDVGVVWFEEPVSSDDLEGLAHVRDATSIDVAAGEYGGDLYELRRLCGAVDCLQIDATRAGGITTWQDAAALAAAHGLEVSAHCAPNLHAHAAASTPNTRHLEWFHDHVRIEGMLLDGVLDPTGGTVRPRRDAPGNGLAWRDPDAEPFRVA